MRHNLNLKMNDYMQRKSDILIIISNIVLIYDGLYQTAIILNQ